jgi:hypothetical protein
MESETITFDAVVYKVQTLVDGGLRLTLDLPETAIAEAARLMECKRIGIALKISCALINRQEQYAIQEGSKRKSRWQTA